jgi:excisionase family DNA binding protein
MKDRGHLPLADSLTIEQAEAILGALPEYDTFTKDKKIWWGADEVAKGLGVGRQIVLDWCDNGSINGAVQYPGRAGWRIPRSQLLIFLAQRHLRGGQ